LRSPYSNYLSRDRIIYPLGFVLIPLAIAIALLAWTGGNLRTAIVNGAISVGWFVFMIFWTRKISRQQDKANHDSNRVLRRKRLAFLLRIIALLVLIYGCIALATALVKDQPLYVILEAVWVIIFGILFIGLPSIVIPPAED